MKTALQYFAKGVIATAVVFALSCEADQTNFDTPENTINPDAGVDSDANSSTGSLSLEGVAVSINTDMEMRSSYNSAGDDYIIYIVDETSKETIYKETYATVKALTTPLSMSVGSYTLYAKSVETVAAAAWDLPQYESIGYSFTIGADKTTYITDAVVCTMSNIRTSVEISADLKDLFLADNKVDTAGGEWKLETTLSMGENSMTFSRDETRSGYFAVQDGITTLNVNMRGMYNAAPDGAAASYVPLEWGQTITGVTAGQARDIEIKIEHYNEGQLDITFVVTTWVYDEALGVQMSSQLLYASNEQVIYDPDDDKSDLYSPAVVLDGVEGSEYYIFPDMFDSILATYSPVLSAAITPETGSVVETIDFSITSDNDEFTQALSAAGIGSLNSLYSDGVIASTYSDMLTLSKDETTGVFTAELTYEGAQILGDESYRGTHTAKLVVMDDLERRSVTTLNINAILSDKLAIIWDDGLSFGEDHYIMKEGEKDYVELPVNLTITSKTGLTKLTIDIVSDALTAEELESYYLAQSMDLINPATTLMESQLMEFGFPVRDEVEGQTELHFSITQFMPLLAMLSEAGSGDKTVFTITAGDDNSAEDCVVDLTLIRK